MAIPLTKLLQYASAGWHLFPIRARSKEPLVKWKNGATDSHEQIAQWHQQWPSCNWGVACGPSGLLIVDIDTKDGKNGAKSWAALAAENETPDTFTVGTPSGGLHYYYKGDAPTTGPKSKTKLGEGIDTRGVGGMALIPGCELANGTYEITHKARPAALPAWIPGILGAVTERQCEQVPLTDLDQEHHVRLATSWLQTSEPPVEGERNDSAFRVAAHCKDLGVSEGVCLDLMLAHWNDRCSPPMDTEELQRTIESAYENGENAPGILCPEVIFSPVEIEEAEEPKEETGLKVLRASEIMPENIPRRQWVLGYRLILKYLSVTVSPGGVGKSNLTILEALAVNTGKNLTGDEVHVRGAVWMHNAEDPMHEIKLRVAAACQHHGVAPPKDLILTSGRDKPLPVVKADGSPNLDVLATIINTIKKYNIRLFIGDPFVRMHHADENDNGQMDLVVQCFDQIMARTGCSVHLVHHTRKKTAEGGYGDMDTARGASAVVSAARIVHTLNAMTPKVGAEYGLDEDECRWYVRLDDAKGNMAPPADGVRWFKKVSVELPNGDKVGTLEPTTLEIPIPVVDDGTFCKRVLDLATEVDLLNKPMALTMFIERLERDPGVKAYLGKDAKATLDKHLPIKKKDRVIRRTGDTVLEVSEPG